MSKTSDLQIVSEDLGILGPMPERQARWSNNLGLLAIIQKMGLTPNWHTLRSVVGKRSNGHELNSESPSFFIIALRRRLVAWKTSM